MNGSIYKCNIGSWCAVLKTSIVSIACEFFFWLIRKLEFHFFLLVYVLGQYIFPSINILRQKHGNWSHIKYIFWKISFVFPEQYNSNPNYSRCEKSGDRWDGQRNTILYRNVGDEDTGVTHNYNDTTDTILESDNIVHLYFVLFTRTTDAFKLLLENELEITDFKTT